MSSLKYLRQDLPKVSSFTVTQLPYKAKLDQNESPNDLPLDLKNFLLTEIGKLEWNRYPQPSFYYEVKKEFALSIDKDPEQIFLSLGCDQLIQGAYWVAGGKDKKAIIFEPTYPMFSLASIITQTYADKINLGPEHKLTKKEIEGRNYDIIFIVAPNNPTGTLPEEGVVESALNNKGLVFIDEAYYDFSQKTWESLVNKHPNLFIARSCSKSLLAGMRLGYGITHPETIRKLELIYTVPYHLSFAQLIIAKYFKLIKPYIKESSCKVIQERERVSRKFEELKIPFIKSYANFILFKLNEPQLIHKRLAEVGIRVRDVSHFPGLGGYLRVTIGTEEENNLFLDKLKSFL